MANLRKKSALLAACLLLALAASACANSAGTSGAISLDARRAMAAEVDARLVDAGNEFGMRLHRQLVQAEQNKNVFVSPLSVSLAFAMVYNGSRGDTQAEMARALGWQGMSLDELNRGFATLLSLMRQPGGGVQLRIANSLWPRKGAAFYDDFMENTRTFYGAQVSELDFRHPEAAATVNRWVNKQTSGKIPKVVEALDAAEVLLLINAVHFQGKWQKEFDPSATKEENFRLQDGSLKPVRMMKQTGTYEYREDEEVQAVRLPYGEGQMDMLIIVPKETSSLDELHDKLWADTGRWREPFPKKRGEIQMPRFKIEYGKELGEPLQAMGMTLPFDDAKADFSGMAPIPPNLYISAVKHKTFLEVNEKGTEAAAATAIHAKAGSAPIDAPFRIVVNRPFFFAIEDRQIGAWLFVGSVVEP